MAKKILVIDGHPDRDKHRLCHALAEAYADGAQRAGHSIRRITLADLEIPPLRTRADWEEGTPQPEVRRCQDDVAWADHLVIIYPQVFRPGFAIAAGARTMWPGLLRGKSARIVVTMGMPAWLYRWYFLAHSLKSLKRNILRFAGIGPISQTLIGMAESGSAPKWIEKMRELGRDGA